MLATAEENWSRFPERAVIALRSYTGIDRASAGCAIVAVDDAGTTMGWPHDLERSPVHALARQGKRRA